jgi:hypothetical protein
MRSKGTFNTCSICLDVNALIKNATSPGARDVLTKFRRAHLERQANERRDCELRRLEAAKVGPDGAPQMAFILCDAMTHRKGDVPKITVDKRQASSDSQAKCYSNRVVGVEVVCGPINTTFLYTMNNTVRSGANCIIEVIRQALRDLQAMLKAHNDSFVVPKKISFQFDNCGENKNK